MKDGTIRIHALRVKQKIGQFYIASLSARDLVNVSYSDVRRLAKDQRDVERYLGIQRPVDPRRITKIKQYLGSPDATFPTAVILAVDERCVEVQDIDDTLSLMTLKPFDGKDGEESIPIGKIAKVLDGQHRIAAFLDDSNDWMFKSVGEEFFLNIAIFVGADISEQANIFATVNLAQTKVNRSLVYDLTELAKTPSPHKTCHNVAVALDQPESSPFYKRIKRLAAATPGRTHEPLTQAAFVEALVLFISKDLPAAADDRNAFLLGKRPRLANRDELTRTPFRNLFLLGKEVDITEIIYNYFSAIRDKWPKSWQAKDKTGNLLPRSNAFKAFMRFLKEDVYLEVVKGDVGRVPKVSEFRPFFESIDVSDDDFTSRNFVPGSSGQSTFLKMLRGEIRIEDITKRGE